MNTLLYIRRNKKFNKSVLDYALEFEKDYPIKTISEYYNGDYRIDINSSQWDYSADVQSFIDQHFKLSDIIFRDRVLRNTSFSECLILIRRATGSIKYLFEKNEFHRLISYPVDNYIMDIMVQIAGAFSVPCVGISSFFLKGYKRITIYGEHQKVRSPDLSEVTEVIDLLESNFRSHMAPTKRTALKRAVVRYIKYKPRYLLFYILGAKVLGRREYDLLATPYNTTVRQLINFGITKYFKSMSKINFQLHTVFIPLHYFPEATIEYWSGDSNLVEFEDMLHVKLDELSKKYEQIILKEHPATVYDNPPYFYKKLLKNPKVVFIDPFVSTSKIMDQVDVIGCWTGTVE